MDFIEKRRSPRYQGKLPVELEKGTGITCDFSASGVYFNTDQCFLPAHPIEFFLNLEHSNLGAPVRVRYRGEVVRVEPKGEKLGVAVAVNFCEIEGIRRIEDKR